MAEEAFTFTNLVHTGDKYIRLDELPEEQRRKIANELLRRSLSAIPNTKIERTA